MNAALVPDLDEATYHAETTLSASGAKVLLGHRPPSPASDALKFGRLFHIAILEPDRLAEYTALDAEKIGVKADGTPAAVPTMTQAWKKAVAEAAADGLTVVAQTDLDRAQAMAAAVLEHPTASRIIAMATDYELSAYADHATGARVRARFDMAGPIIGDLKTIRDANPAKFGRTAHDFMYHLQAAHYLDVAEAVGMAPAAFAFVLVEKEPTPGGIYRVSVVELASDAITLGRRLMDEACRRWLALDRRIDLPSYGDGFSTVDLPSYAYYAEDSAA